MRSLTRGAAAACSLMLVALGCAIWPNSAEAKPCNQMKYSGSCEVKAKKNLKHSRTGTSDRGRTNGGPTPEQQMAVYQRATKNYYRQLGSYQDCLAAGGESCSSPTVVPEIQGVLVTLTGTPGGPPLMSPGQAGAIAVARLQLPLNAPKVGPDPKVNKWKMAAVGYPLWVWAEP